jgi:non-lysosomal glucosylceramidase
MGADNPEAPEYQAGGGCLADQLIGQYLAEIGGMGPLVSPDNIRKTLRSIYAYNYKPSLARHDSVQRTYALNDEAAVIVCDYGKAERPRIPFPYYAESWTGQEYLVAALMMNWEMVAEGVECVTNIRARYDGEKRNPWDEPECGHHYARAMSSWSTVIALSGFAYDGTMGAVVVAPRVAHERFECIWATGTGWGTFSYRAKGAGTLFELAVIEGSLRCRSCQIAAVGSVVDARLGTVALEASVEQRGGRLLASFHDPLTLVAGSAMQIEVRA